MRNISIILEGLKELREGKNTFTGKTFKNKQELVDFVKKQTNVELENDPNNSLNRKRNILYTKIEKADVYITPVTQLLNKYGIRYENHMKDYFWIWIK